MSLEFDEVHAAIGGGILVLLADRLTKSLDFEHASLVRQPLLWHEDTAMRVERVDERHRKRARRTKARAARNVGDRRDLDPGIDPLHAQRFAQDRMLDLIEMVDQFGTRVFQVVLAHVKERMDHDEAIFRNRTGEYCPATAKY